MDARKLLVEKKDETRVVTAMGKAGGTTGEQVHCIQ
jgi:hypothetical protein